MTDLVAMQRTQPPTVSNYGPQPPNQILLAYGKKDEGKRAVGKVTTYYPGGGDPRIEGPREDRTGQIITQTQHGVEPVFKRFVGAVAANGGQWEGVSLPVLTVAGSPKYGYGSIVLLRGESIRMLLLESGASQEMAAHFSKVGVPAIVRDTGGAFKNVPFNRLDLVAVKQNRTFEMDIEIVFASRDGKDQPKERLRFAEGLIASGKIYQSGSTPDSQPANPIKPKTNPTQFEAGQNIDLSFVSLPKRLPADLYVIENSVQARYLKATGSQLSDLQEALSKRPVYVRIPNAPTGTLLTVPLVNLPRKVQEKIAADLNIPITQVVTKVPSVILQVAPEAGVPFSGSDSVIELSQPGKGVQAQLKVNVVGAGQVVPTNAAPGQIDQQLKQIYERTFPDSSVNVAPAAFDPATYADWNTKQQRTGLEVPQWRPLGSKGVDVWADQFGDVWFRREPLSNWSQARIDALVPPLSQDEWNIVSRRGEPQSVGSMRQYYFERLEGLQRELKAVNPTRPSTPKPSLIFGSSIPLSRDEKLLESRYPGLPVVSLTARSKPYAKDLSDAVDIYYGSLLNQVFLADTTGSHDPHTGLGVNRSAALTKAEAFDRHSQHKSESPFAFQNYVIAEIPLRLEAYNQKFADYKRIAQGRKLTAQESTHLQALNTNYRLFVAVNEYYRTIESQEGTPAQKEALYQTLSNLVKAHLSGEKFEAALLPKFEDGVRSGAYVYTLEFAMNEILTKTEAGKQILKDPGWGGLKHLLLALNSGDYNHPGIQRNQVRQYLIPRAIFATENQLRAGESQTGKYIAPTPSMPAGIQVKRPDLTENQAEYLNAAQQDKARNDWAQFFIANPKDWQLAKADPALMAYLNRLMFKVGPDGIPDKNQTAIFSVQLVERRKAELINNYQHSTAVQLHKRPESDIVDMSNREVYVKYVLPNDGNIFHPRTP